MTDIQLYTKLSSLPMHLKEEVSDFIDFLKFKTSKKTEKQKRENRVPDKARGLIDIKADFDDPIDIGDKRL